MVSPYLTHRDVECTVQSNASDFSYPGCFRNELMKALDRLIIIEKKTFIYIYLFTTWRSKKNYFQLWYIAIVQFLIDDIFITYNYRYSY